jgi:hypothetical protein
MQTLSNPTEFTKALKQTRRIQFQDNKLKVEIHVCEERSCKKSYIVKYYHLINGQWVAFSTFFSNLVNEIILDINYEFKQFNIN